MSHGVNSKCAGKFRTGRIFWRAKRADPTFLDGHGSFKSSRGYGAQVLGLLELTKAPRLWLCEIWWILFAVDVVAKSIITFGEPIEVVDLLQGIFYIRVLKNRYSIEKYIIFGWFELEFAYILCLGCAFFFQNQSWRLSLWKTCNNVWGATRGDYSAERIFADSTFGRSLLPSKSAALDPPSCRIFLKSAGSMLHVFIFFATITAENFVSDLKLRYNLSKNKAQDLKCHL